MDRTRWIVKWLTVWLGYAGLAGCSPSPPPPPPPASELRFLTTPDPVVGMAFQVEVGAVDDAGVPTTNFSEGVTLALAGGTPGAKLLPASPATHPLNGVATFSGIDIDTAGTGYTLVATAAGLKQATSVAFDVTAPPTHLAFVSPMLGFVATARTPFDAQVRTLDAQSRPANFDGQVTLALAPNPNGGVLGGTLTVSTVNGVASFSGLTIDKAGAGYTLLASATGLIGVGSDAFDVLPDPPDHLVFVSPLSGFRIPAGSPFEVRLQAVDAAQQPTSYSGMISLTLASGSPAGNLLGGGQVAAVNGVATFPAVSVDTPGNGFQLVAKSTLPDTTSDTFNVTASVCAISPGLQKVVLVLPPGSAGFAYPTQHLTASGCGTGLVWSISSGALPAGLAISSTTGDISGTTTTVQVGLFTVKVTGSAGSATQQFEIQVVSGCLIEPGLAPSNEFFLGNGTVGSPFSVQLQATPGCGTNPAWTVSTGALPAGLFLGASDGLVNGTPASAGTAHFTVQVTGSAGNARQQYSITIGSCSISPPQVPSAAPYVLLPGLQNETYISQLFLAIGSCGRVNPAGWQVSAGALPPGLLLNSDFGQLAGTPSQMGTFPFTITVTASGGTAHQDYTLTINPATPDCVLQPGTVPSSNTLAFPDVHLNQFAQRMVAASTGCGGIAGNAFAITSGNLPTGMQINSNGAINGTPTALGLNTFTLEVTGRNGKNGSQTYSITVVP